MVDPFLSPLKRWLFSGQDLAPWQPWIQCKLLRMKVADWRALFWLAYSQFSTAASQELLFFVDTSVLFS